MHAGIPRVKRFSREINVEDARVMVHDIYEDGRHELRFDGSIIQFTEWLVNSGRVSVMSVVQALQSDLYDIGCDEVTVT